MVKYDLKMSKLLLPKIQVDVTGIFLIKEAWYGFKLFYITESIESGKTNR